MAQIFEEVDEKQTVLNICKNYGLNIDLLSEFFKLRAQGLQTIDIAPKLGIHRVTVSRYLKALQSMKESEFNFLYNYARRQEDEENN